VLKGGKVLKVMQVHQTSSMPPIIHQQPLIIPYLLRELVIKLQELDKQQLHFHSLQVLAIL
jgi:hypothetical protein